MESDVQNVTLAPAGSGGPKYQYHLLFIDFATKKYLQVELVELPKNLAEQPALSHRCRLYGIAPVRKGSCL